MEFVSDHEHTMVMLQIGALDVRNLQFVNRSAFSFGVNRTELSIFVAFDPILNIEVILALSFVVALDQVLQNDLWPIFCLQLGFFLADYADNTD